MGVIGGHKESRDFWGVAKLQSALGADNPHSAAVYVIYIIHDLLFLPISTIESRVS